MTTHYIDFVCRRQGPGPPRRYAPDDRSRPDRRRGPRTEEGRGRMEPRGTAGRTPSPGDMGRGRCRARSGSRLGHERSTPRRPISRRAGGRQRAHRSPPADHPFLLGVLRRHSRPGGASCRSRLRERPRAAKPATCDAFDLPLLLAKARNVLAHRYGSDWRPCGQPGTSPLESRATTRSPTATARRKRGRGVPASRWPYCRRLPAHPRPAGTARLSGGAPSSRCALPPPGPARRKQRRRPRHRRRRRSHGGRHRRGSR